MTPTGTRRARHAVATAIVVALVVVVGLVAALVVAHDTTSTKSSGPSGPSGPPVGPRVARSAIVFLVDDMSDFSCARTAQYLPKSSAWLRERGTCFENASTATPVCCPARAQLQTGQLGHNNGVERQVDATNIDYRDTVQHDLGDLGLSTIGIGKNLNGIPTSDYYGPDARQTGFDDFHFWDSYKDLPGTFELFADDGTSAYSHDGLNTTQTSGTYLLDFLHRQIADHHDFYAYSAFFAPHKQNFLGKDGTRADFPVPTPRNARRPVPRFRYQPEAHAKDKLETFHQPPRDRDFFSTLNAARVRSLYDVDDQMARVLRLLERSGILDTTAVIFTSDNGYTDHGESNWDGKSIPYPASTDVPMLAMLPGSFAPGAVSHQDVGLIDVPATLYDLFGLAPGHLLDGHSLLSDYRRDYVYGEYRAERSALVRNESGLGSSGLPSWNLVKRGRVSYVEWYRRDGTLLRQEYYRDPAMLRNVLYPGYGDRAPSPAAVERMQALLHGFSDCAGTVEQGSSNPCT